MNPKLQEAVTIFKELGWENVTAENVLTLPTGTPEQKKIVLAGLKNGEWGGFAEENKNSWSWKSHVDVDTGNLALFAIRIGVDTRRAFNICFSCDKKMLLKVIIQRGEKFAINFVEKFSATSQRFSENGLSNLGEEVVYLVDKLNLEIPQNVEYMKDWAVCIASALNLDVKSNFWQSHDKTKFSDTTLITKRFIQHVETGVALNTPATGPFGTIIPAGVKLNLLPREKAIDLTFSALDASVRPGDRKAWLQVMEMLEVSDKNLCDRAESIIPLLATGDNHIINTLAPPLIAGVDNDLLTETLINAFATTTKKGKQLVLKNALMRNCPPDAEELIPWLTIFWADKDKTITKLAHQLAEKWQLNLEEIPEADQAATGLWQPTPPIWQVPNFSIGEVSPENLTELASQIMRRKSESIIYDLTTERFLAMANRLAFINPEEARMSLQGLRSDWGMFEHLINWVKRQPPRYELDKIQNWKGDGFCIDDLLTARIYVIAEKLDQLPCLLSTPSKQDLSITLPELIASLMLYEQSKTNALEPDFLLALTRLDLTTQTEADIAYLKDLKVPIVRHSGEMMTKHAGEVILDYLNDPFIEPQLDQEDGYYSKVKIIKPQSLSDFPNREMHGYQSRIFTIFPHFGDVALGDVNWGGGYVDHAKGIVMKQMAKRARPLPPGASINFLASLRSEITEDALTAVTDAWERGLLRPGVADIRYLDWRTTAPSHLVLLATALDGVARDGLLSVVWPLIDDLVQASLDAPRLIAGTAELVELAITFLPEVELAVAKGLADKAVLQLPAVCALSMKKGNSQAVSLAKKLVSLLPVVEAKKEEIKPVMTLSKADFDKVWQVREQVELLDDGVQMTVDWASEKKKEFVFTLSLPDVGDKVYQVSKGWTYDLEYEGQAQAQEENRDVRGYARKDHSQQGYLHWDVAMEKLVYSPVRNWREEHDGSLTGERTPLSASLLTIIIGLLAQDGDAIYYAPRLLKQYIETGVIDAHVVRYAIDILLQYPVVSPAKLVRCLEKDNSLLPTCWPVLTESIKLAGEQVRRGEKPPVWVNRILDVALRYSDYLLIAMKEGLIPGEDAKWQGLKDIAELKSKSVAIGKAQKLEELLELDEK